MPTPPRDCHATWLRRNALDGVDYVKVVVVDSFGQFHRVLVGDEVFTVSDYELVMASESERVAV